jgi:hypothetical protein
MSQPVFEANIRAYETGTEYARHFYGLLAKTGLAFKRKDGTITYVDESVGPRRIVGLDEFRAMAGNLLNVRRGGQGARRGGDTAAFLDRDEAVHLLGSSERGRLPELEFVLHEPAVYTAVEGPRLIEEPGYDCTAGAYYWRRPGSTRIKPQNQTKHLEKCFSGVPFLAKEYRNNIIAWLVGGMTLDDVSPPMLAVTGNDRGVGKSSLVQACGYILTGQPQNAIKPTGDEFEKQLGAKFAAEERFIMLDNITTMGNRAYGNPRLASFLTEGRSKQVRRLGQSRHITQTGVLFALTANDCKLDQDLATRSLAVALYKEVPGPMEPYVLRYAKEHRSEIYGELLGLALRRETGYLVPRMYATCRFVDWIDYVVPIIQPVFGDLAIREAEDLDDRLQDLFGWGADNLDRAFKASDLYTEIMGKGESGLRGLWISLITAKSDRGRMIKLGSFLRGMVGKQQMMSQDFVVRLEDAGVDSHSKVAAYVFREVK